MRWTNSKIPKLGKQYSKKSSSGQKLIFIPKSKSKLTCLCIQFIICQTPGLAKGLTYFALVHKFLRLDTHFLMTARKPRFLNVLWIFKIFGVVLECAQNVFECAENLTSSKCIWHFSYRLKDHIAQNFLTFILPFSWKNPLLFLYLFVIFCFLEELSIFWYTNITK